MLAIRLGTGRGHQIRIQLASRQWPIIGDRRYGPDFPGKPFDMGLFACLLGFYHPISREWIEFSALPPGVPPWLDFREVKLSLLPEWLPAEKKPSADAED